jgi:hypothetical protein
MTVASAKNPINWTEIDPLLGKIPDTEISKKYAIGVGVVRRHRLFLHISSYLEQRGKSWDDIDPLIGVLPTDAIHKTHKMSNTAINKRRRDREIEAFNDKSHKRYDWADIDPVLGTMSDRDISKQYDIPESAVTCRRKKLGVKPFGKIVINWPKIDPLLGTATDKDIAMKFGVSAQSVTRRRRMLGIERFSEDICSGVRAVKINWSRIEAFLGKMTDIEVASMFGINKHAVTARRQLNRIPAFKKSLDWTKILDEYRGRSDREIAIKFNVSTAQVNRERSKHGLTRKRGEIANA